MCLETCPTVEQLKARIAELEQDLQETKAELDGNVKAAETIIGRQKEQLADYKGLVDGATEQVEELEQFVRNRDAEITELKAALEIRDKQLRKCGMDILDLYGQIDELKTKVREVRQVQKDYFRTRDKSLMPKAKQLESELDKMIQ